MIDIARSECSPGRYFAYNAPVMLYYRKRDGYWIIMCTRRAVVIVVIMKIIYVAEFQCFSHCSRQILTRTKIVMKQKHFSLFVETKTSYFNKLVPLLCWQPYVYTNVNVINSDRRRQSGKLSRVIFLDASAFPHYNRLMNYCPVSGLSTGSLQLYSALQLTFPMN